MSLSVTESFLEDYKYYLSSSSSSLTSTTPTTKTTNAEAAATTRSETKTSSSSTIERKNNQHQQQQPPQRLTNTEKKSSSSQSQLSISSPSSSSSSSPQSFNNNNNNNNNNGKNSRDKPYIVIHVGPPKTGSTTIQFALEHLNASGILAQDNYRYDDYLVERIMSKKCSWKLLSHRKKFYKKNMHATNNVASTSNKNGTTNNRDDESNDGDSDINIPHFNDILNEEKGYNDRLASSLIDNVDCWNKTIRLLQPYLETKTNLMYSGEPWSFKSHRVWSQTHFTMIDWKSIYITLSKDWNILVVFGYRRYYEWLVSSHQQLNRYTPSKVETKDWPKKGQKHNRYSINKIPVPQTRESMFKLLYRYSDDLKQEMIQHPYIPFKILNMHNNDDDNTSASTTSNKKKKYGLVSNFVCDVLPNAPQTCKYSIEHSHELEVIKNPSESLFYDVLGVAAYHEGYIDVPQGNYDRHDVAVAIQEYHENVLNRTSFDFPLKQPKIEKLQNLLNLSLTLEEEVLPEFATSPGVKEKHESNFWKYTLDKQRYSWIDTHQVLHNDTNWISFFKTNYQ